MRHLPILFAALVANPAGAQTGSATELSLEQQTALRCAAAFAIVAHQQAAGNAEALSLPPMRERGREFFVRFSAQLMDETGMTRGQVADLLKVEAQMLSKRGNVARIMPACLLLLEASGV